MGDINQVLEGLYKSQTKTRRTAEKSALAETLTYAPRELLQDDDGNILQDDEGNFIYVEVE
jgi:hypothetical protein